MNIIKTKIEGLLIIEPQVFGDERGFFVETYHKKRYAEAGIPSFSEEFVQDNLSMSSKGVLRGLHWQMPPFAQGKLVQVIQGKILDVAVDIRFGSLTFGQYVVVELSGENKKQFWIPPGFAHGFVSLEDNTIFSYKCTNLYNKDSERGIMWNDPDINVDWQLKKYGISNPIISEKDQKNKFFKDIEKDFICKL
ncbi:MAG: DtdP-4-dehydrorhamnose 3,5-epimerase [Candidatus Moranbacteria bacterium GW2011_GWE2_35_2-]|nr:MAG: DtdP-4-dehydrorhamnose 3,5-epimerase [Candidatus Moranbacteria bacterium GW2011_GWE2_35_2-]KKQ04626.1 MAG: DtdP-4-dehydrorhamnose 3,5-epimerase [Candidatus Moranbacteria bacterium GW2011_GWF1_36_4]KKQ21981.1 MAG: DtdP-4-dehydrorhamnose 3,5-epimerase [Candidatus Moranbacteria bacterium GW2011_GWF2_37_11]KKQ29102.1 MAG: DtdP-4-dehydrorhamnose 3,5-epimerase [Candidatus Moranbacteria bacterium GW2011_GWD1_37_17]KKQ31087.1 MAG: DtdP-4-dehydrorhamnose 3,5-epimerase [Candidatus Moranbacteria b